MDSSFQSLFVSFCRIGLFGFGGGYAMLPLISHEVVNSRSWASANEFSDMVAISQMTPGPVALNAATYVGFSVQGLLGAAVATLSACLPPFLIMYGVCMFFGLMKGNARMAGAMRLLRPAVVGLVLAAALFLMNRESFVDWKSGVVFAVAFVLTAFLKVHPIPLLAASGLFGWLAYS